MKVGIFELKNNKVCFKYEFMDKQFTKVMKGITITMVFFSHVGNANNVRLFAPLGVQFTRYILYLFNNIIFAKKKEMDFMQFLLILAPA